MKINITCQQCKCPYEYEIEDGTVSRKRFCPVCALSRKKICIKDSNSRSSSGNPIGRPLGIFNNKEDKDDIEEVVFAWDECSVLI